MTSRDFLEFTLYGDIERVSQPVCLVSGYHLLGALNQRLSILFKLCLLVNIANSSDRDKVYPQDNSLNVVSILTPVFWLQKK